MPDMSDVVGNLDHEQKQTARYIEVSPAHGDRKETPLFKHARTSLVLHFGCYIDNAECNHENPLEAHHYFVEWSKSGKVDWDKLARHKGLTNPQNGLALDFVDWDAVKADPAVFVDSQANLMILCASHHRDTANGIHHIPYSLWILQKYVVDGFDFTKAISGK